MKIAILASTIVRVVSQSSLRISQCQSQKAFSQCYSLQACTWCTAATGLSGCYSKSFANTLRPGVVTCATRETSVQTLTDGTSGQRMSSSQWSLSSPKPYHLDRRTVAALFGASAFGVPLRSWAAPEEMKLVTFDGTKGTTQQWVEVDDSIIPGGKSTGKTTVSNGVLRITGKVERQSDLTPGFVIGRTGGSEGISKKFPDASSCEGISFIAKSSNSYDGYHISISNQADNGFKAKFDAPRNKFGIVRIPFKDFTSSYNDITGDPIKKCQDSPMDCIGFSPANLRKIGGISFWAEGVTGAVDLEIKEIGAYGCTPQVAPQVSQSEGEASPSTELGAFNSASGISFVWPLSAAAFGILISAITRIRGRSSSIASPVLG